MKHSNKKFKLTTYSAMAAGFITLCNQADGQIVYTDLTPDGYADDFDQFMLDMNDDGLVDFYFVVNTFGDCSAGCDTHRGFSVAPAYSNEVVYDVKGTIVSTCTWDSSFNIIKTLAPLVEEGLLIKPSFPFTTANAKIFTHDWDYPGGYCFPAFNYELGNFPSSEMIAVKLKIDGQSHYGWIRLSLNDWEYMYATIEEYAYEATADIPIAAGDMSTPECPYPSVTSVIVNPNGFKLNWSEVEFATGYRLMYREVGEVLWTTVQSYIPQKKVAGLFCNTTYEYQLYTICDDGLGEEVVSDYSPLETVTTGVCRIGNNAIDEDAINMYAVGSELFINFEFDVSEPIQFVLSNSIGQVILTDKITQRENIITLNIPNGIYFASVEMNGERIIKKIMFNR